MSADQRDPDERPRPSSSQHRPGPELVTAELRRRFRARVLADLERRPLDLDLVDHRRRIGRLLQQREEMTHHDLLGVPLGTRPATVQAAFEEVARLVHPVHADRLDMPGIGRALDDLFDRALAAYLVLSDPDRSRAYARSLPLSDPAGSPGEAPDAEGRRRERARIGEERYRLAVELEARGDYHAAIQVAEQAAQADPKVEYWELLARCQERNPSWLRRAVVSYERALEIDPDRRDLRYRLAEVYKEMGDLKASMSQRERLVGGVVPGWKPGRAAPGAGGSRGSAGGRVGRWLARVGGWLRSWSRRGE